MQHPNGPVAEPATAPQLTYDRAFSRVGKLALITGGGSGIGFDIARCMAGAGVVITGRREQPLQKTAQILGPQAHYAVNDVTERTLLDGLVAETAVFPASEAARYVTGVSLPVDGGNSIGF